MDETSHILKIIQRGYIKYNNSGETKSSWRKASKQGVQCIVDGGHDNAADEPEKEMTSKSATSIGHDTCGSLNVTAGTRGVAL